VRQAPEFIMLKPTESRFASEYNHALSEYLASADESGLIRASELGARARALALPVHELVAVHRSALLAACGASDGQQRAAEFLIRSCEAAEAERSAGHEQFLRQVAHELRTPLTTLRLSLQVSLGKLEKGEAIAPLAIQKAISQVDKLTTIIGDLFKTAELAPHSVGQPRS
jgi:signal transduction histidine kinase